MRLHNAAMHYTALYATIILILLWKFTSSSERAQSSDTRACIFQKYEENKEEKDDIFV